MKPRDVRDIGCIVIALAVAALGVLAFLLLRDMTSRHRPDTLGRGGENATQIEMQHR